MGDDQEPAVAAAQSSAVPPASPLSLKRLVASTALALLLLMGAVVFVGVWFREPLFEISRLFVELFRGPGVAVGFFLPDAFTIPLPNDAFSTFGLAGGMGFWEVVLWATAGSLLGGNVGYLCGRALRRTAWMRRFLQHRGAAIELLLRRYGALALAAAAITPLPYSIACWASGALKMRFDLFLAVSLLRFVRVAGYLYLIDLGLVAVSP